MSKWEVFKFEGKTAIPKLSIRDNGQIGINSAGVRRYQLEKYDYVVLMINTSENKIGVKFTNDENLEGARKFKIIQGGATISAKNFVEYYGLNQISEKRIKCEWDSGNEMIIAKYVKEKSEPTTEHGSNGSPEESAE